MKTVSEMYNTLDGIISTIRLCREEVNKLEYTRTESKKKTERYGKKT